MTGPKDPRQLQIMALGGMLVYGLGFLDFPGPGWIYLIYPVAALILQWLLCRLVGIAFDFRSPLISSLSLCLLLHTSSWAWAIGAVAIAIGSKFLLRFDGRHMFNPTCLAIVVTLLFTDQVWVSPGQWGLGAFLGFAAVCMGAWVLHHTRRSDITLAFLLAWTGLLLGRALWLGDPLSIPLLQLQNISLLIFAFFMISDPMTIPDRRAARMGFATVVAAVGYVLQYHLYFNEGLFYALAACAPLVPLLNRWLPGERYRWAPEPVIPGR